jgi:hypothetical protein
MTEFCSGSQQARIMVMDTIDCIAARVIVCKDEDYTVPSQVCKIQTNMRRNKRRLIAAFETEYDTRPLADGPQKGGPGIRLLILCSWHRHL